MTYLSSAVIMMHWHQTLLIDPVITTQTFSCSTFYRLGLMF